MSATKPTARPAQNLDMYIPKFAEKLVDPPAQTYSFTIINSHGAAIPFVYDLTKIKAHMMKQSGNIAAAFRVIHLKNSICKKLAIPYGSMNLIFKGKIITDKDNLFNVGIHEGARLHVILKTDSRKEYEQKEMNKDPKYLPEGERGQEKVPAPTPREQEYRKGNFGLSDIKMSMLVDTMMKNPILIQRYSENAMVQRLIDDNSIRKEITEISPYMANIRKNNSKLDAILNGNDPQGLSSCKEYISDTKNVRKLNQQIEKNKTLLQDLCNHIIEPDTHPENPMLLLERQNQGVEWEISPTGDDDNANAMFEGDGDEDMFASNATSDKDESPNVRADLKAIWKLYKRAYQHMKDMGLDDDTRILEQLKVHNGDLNEALDSYYS